MIDTNWPCNEDKYYEAHVTIEPVFDEERSILAGVAQMHGFRLAELLMKTRTNETAERRDKDSFCTGRDKDIDALLVRMWSFMRMIQMMGLKVWRYKVEACLLDVRTSRE